MLLNAALLPYIFPLLLPNEEIRDFLTVDYWPTPPIHPILPDDTCLLLAADVPQIQELLGRECGLELFFPDEDDFSFRMLIF